MAEGEHQRRKHRVQRLALILYVVSFAGFAVSMFPEDGNALWLVWLVYASGGALVAAIVVTVFGISLIGEK